MGGETGKKIKHQHAVTVTEWLEPQKPTVSGFKEKKTQKNTKPTKNNQNLNRHPGFLSAPAESSRRSPAKYHHLWEKHQWQTSRYGLRCSSVNSLFDLMPGTDQESNMNCFYKTLLILLRSRSITRKILKRTCQHYILVVWKFSSSIKKIPLRLRMWELVLLTICLTIC